MDNKYNCILTLHWTDHSHPLQSVTKYYFPPEFQSDLYIYWIFYLVLREHPKANIVAIDYDPGASEVNQLNRIKLMLSTAQKNLKKELK